MGCGASAEKKSGESGKPNAQAAPAPEATAEQQQAIAQQQATAQQKRISQKLQDQAPPKKLKAIKDSFSALDKDGSGRIDATELKALIEKVGADTLTDQEKEQLYLKMDTDKNGTVSMSEFIQWVLTQEGEQDAVASYATHKGLAPVHEAVIAGDTAKLTSLLDAGGNVNQCDINDVTPLHYACRLGNAELATLLLSRKSDVSAKTSDTGRMPLHAASENGSVPVVELLLGAGAQINAIDGRERTPLHWSCCSSQEGAAAVLLKAKADVHCKSVAGYTAFAMAQDWSSSSLANLIAEAGGTR